MYYETMGRHRNTPSSLMVMDRPPLHVPIWQRRTYGVFRGRVLVGVYVAGEDDECIRDGYQGKGLTIFMLKTHDVTVRPDCGRVIEGLKSQYEGAKK